VEIVKVLAGSDTTPDELRRLLRDLQDAYDATLEGHYSLRNLLEFLAWYIEQAQAALDGAKP